MKKCLLAVMLSVCCSGALHAAEGGAPEQQQGKMPEGGMPVAQFMGQLQATAVKLNEEVQQIATKTAQLAFTDFMVGHPVEEFLCADDDVVAGIEAGMRESLSDAIKGRSGGYAAKAMLIFLENGMMPASSLEEMESGLVKDATRWFFAFLHAQRDAKRRLAERHLEE